MQFGSPQFSHMDFLSCVRALTPSRPLADARYQEVRPSNIILVLWGRVRGVDADQIEAASELGDDVPGRDQELVGTEETVACVGGVVPVTLLRLLLVGSPRSPDALQDPLS